MKPSMKIRNDRRQGYLGGFSPRVFAVGAISFSMIFGGLMVGTAYAAKDTILRGTLTIDYQGKQDEISPAPLSTDLKIRIPQQHRIAGLKIPRRINGQPFRGQEFTVSLVPSGCVLDGGPSLGVASLRLHQKMKKQPFPGTVFKAPVFNGQYECLFGGASQVMPYDPFDGNHETSVIGELVIWWTQVLSHQNPTTNQSVKEEMHEFFEFPNSQAVHRLWFRSVEYHSVQSPGCDPNSPHRRCNRGGTADGIFNADLRARFKDQVLQ